MKLKGKQRADDQADTEGPTAVLSFRVSKELYDWLDRYARGQMTERGTKHTRQTIARKLLSEAIESIKKSKK